jgi:hypothetical protein
MFAKARQLIQDAKKLIHDAKDARADDGTVDEQEAAGLFEDALTLARDVAPGLVLSEQAKAVLRGLADTINTHLAPAPVVKLVEPH